MGLTPGRMVKGFLRPAWTYPPAKTIKDREADAIKDHQFYITEPAHGLLTLRTQNYGGWRDREEKKTIGRINDNEAQRLLFDRPKDRDYDDLILYFDDGEKEHREMLGRQK